MAACGAPAQADVGHVNVDVGVQADDDLAGDVLARRARNCVVGAVL